MKNRSKTQNKFSKSAIMFVLLTGCAILYQAFMPDTKMPKGNGGIQFTYQVPTDINNPADSMAAALFAWQEFIALTWPAKPNPNANTSGYFRCQPDTTAQPGSTGAGGVTVWETYYHRDELYPNYPDTLLHTLPAPDTIPQYYYGNKTITPASPDTRNNLLNNLDEASEISIANMYFTPLAQRADSLVRNISNPDSAQQKLIEQAQVNAAIMYEAKGNAVIRNYVKKNAFNNSQKRGPALKASINKINNNFSDTIGNFNLPYGAIEIKASWRHYDAAIDNIKQFHWTVGMYYTKNKQGQLTVHNDTLLLVGLHIIQKTPNVPTFVFATFEHVSNEQNGFRFVNAFPQTAKFTDTAIRALPDPGVIAAHRQFAIPNYITGLNKQIQQQLRSMFGQNMVWANYQLIGVQAVVANNYNNTVPKQQFFLSNFATETNNTLQFFQGGLTGPGGNVPDPSLAHVFKFNSKSKKFITYTAGGCVGCHGSQGQLAGGDFSVIAATGNSFIPQAVTPYPTLSNVNQQNPANFPLPKGLTIKGKTSYTITNFDDVKALLDAFVTNHNVPINQAPHGTFWNTTYDKFVTGHVPGVGNSYHILTKGNPANSTIIKILKGPLPGGYPPQMPYNSGSLPLNDIFPRQDSMIAHLSKWIQDSCPNPPTSQTVIPKFKK